MKRVKIRKRFEALSTCAVKQEIDRCIGHCLAIVLVC